MPSAAIDLPTFARALQGETDFPGVASVVCRHATPMFGLEDCGVLLLDLRQRPLVAVDNLVGPSDAERLAYYRDGWREDALLGELLARHVAVLGEAKGDWPYRADAGPRRFRLLLPILEPSGLLGVIACAREHRFEHVLRASLMAMSAQVSVLLVQLGITARSATPFHGLTARQLEVARLVGRGHTNPEIAQVLEVSENTVKKHLKAVFEATRVHNRTELAGLLARSAPPCLLPPGVARVGELATTTIARPA